MVRHNGRVAAREPVQQAGLADIGRTDNCYRETVAQPLAAPFIAQVSLDLARKRLDTAGQLAFQLGGQPFVREIE